MTAFAFNVVKLNNAFLKGIRQPDFQVREKQAVSDTDGSIWQTSAPVIRAAPMARFDTVAAKALFVLMGTSSFPPFVALDGTNGLELLGLKINATGPGYDATSVHASRKCLNGLLMLADLSWKPGEVLTATAEAYLIATVGSTNPVVASTIALPTVPVNTEQLVLSTISGIPSTRIASWDVSISHQVENNDEQICYNHGLPYPVLAKQPGTGGAVEVLLTIETTDLTTAISNGTVVSTFAVLNHNGVGTSAGTATVTLNNPQIREEGITGKPAMRKIVIRATWDGSTQPITIATA